MSATENAAVKRFYERSYNREGLAAQRRYPNEELCRFMGRHFFATPPEARRHVRILEMGCGSGANLWMIAREGFDAFGVDLSQEAINLAQTMLEQYGTEATLAVGDMTRCPFPDRHFDAIVDVFSSNCLDERGNARFLAEVARLLKPGGLFFSYTPSKTSDAFARHAPARLIDASTLDGIHRVDSPYCGNRYPFRFTSGEEHAAALSQAGFRVIHNEIAARTYRNRAEYFEFVVIAAEKRSDAPTPSAAAS